MRRFGWFILVAVVVTLAALFFWWPDEEQAVEAGAVAGDQRPANEGGLPAVRAESKWNAPVVARGERRVSGHVLRDGKPVAGATVTALAAHGEEVLSDLPCQCDNHCGQKLLACGCAEASGQLVELVAARTGEGAPLGRATTDAEGAFTIAGLDATALTLWADAPGAIGWSSDVASDAADARVEVTPGRIIEGKVSSTDGKPAAGALVTAIFTTQSRFFDTVADAQGAFRPGPLPEGKQAVVAMQAGLLPDHQQVDEDELEPVKLELSVPRALSGRVERDGAPVAGAKVTVSGMHRKRSVTSDASGAFRFERLRPGQYDLSAEAGDGVAQLQADLSKHEDRTDVVVRLGKGVVVVGLVTDERGVPIEGADLTLTREEETRKTKSDGAGRFRFPVVREGSRTIWAEHEGFLSGEATGSESEVVLRLERAAQLRGRVLGPGGTVVAKFRVSAWLQRDEAGTRTTTSPSARDCTAGRRRTEGERTPRPTRPTAASRSISSRAASTSRSRRRHSLPPSWRPTQPAR